MMMMMIRFAWLVFFGWLSLAQAAPLGEIEHLPPGRLVAVGGHHLHVNCTGQGGPTVILESGLGGTDLEWVKVQPEVAKFTRVCSYDRAGYGWSERGPQPRTGAVLADELARLLSTLQRIDDGYRPPYVLVGHSLGGLVVRGYASRYPERVAGLVLIDSSHERQFQQLAQNKTQTRKAIAPTGGRSFVISNHYQIPPGLPESVRPVVQTLTLLPDAVITLYDELGAMEQSMTEALAWARLPDVPLRVLAHDSRRRARTAKALRKAELWLELQAELATRTPRGRFSIIADSGHHVHLDQPYAVVEAVRAVVNDATARCAKTVVIEC